MSDTQLYLHDCGFNTACSPPVLPLLLRACYEHYLPCALFVVRAFGLPTLAASGYWRMGLCRASGQGLFSLFGADQKRVFWPGI
jgi:hypothetical protein